MISGIWRTCCNKRRSLFRTAITRHAKRIDSSLQTDIALRSVVVRSSPCLRRSILHCQERDQSFPAPRGSLLSASLCSTLQSFYPIMDIVPSLLLRNLEGTLMDSAAEIEFRTDSANRCCIRSEVPSTCPKCHSRQSPIPLGDDRGRNFSEQYPRPRRRDFCKRKFVMFVDESRDAKPVIESLASCRALRMGVRFDRMEERLF